MAFFNSVEFPTTAFFPTIAFPLIKAQCLSSAPLSIIVGPFIHADSYIFASFAIQTFSLTCSYSSLFKVLPKFMIKFSISGKTSHGYVLFSYNSFAIVSSKLYKFSILHSSISFNPFFNDFGTEKKSSFNC